MSSGEGKVTAVRRSKTRREMNDILRGAAGRLVILDIKDTLAHLNNQPGRVSGDSILFFMLATGGERYSCRPIHGLEKTTVMTGPNASKKDTECIRRTCRRSINQNGVPR